MKTLDSLSDIRRFFYRDDVPTYFVSATPFNLLGLDEWVKNWKFINYIDCFDGQHPNVITPSDTTDRVFQSIEEINNYLLQHKSIVDFIRARGPGRAVFLFFDEETEALCKELDLEVCFPSAQLREAIDNKIATTQIGNEAGVASVPNALGKVADWDGLVALANGADLGLDLVIQTAFGDSGHTTFFIKSEADFAKHAEEIAKEDVVKVMKRIRCRGAALEACVTRHGTIVGPLMTELVGFPELTPYRGGWCGNEVFVDAFPAVVREQARKSTFRFGEALRKRGYRGYFECDYLYDLDTHDVYLGEVNPRVTGASSMTNLASFAHADAPLFLFHLLEFSGAEFELDVAALNERWSDPDNIDNWSQLVIKHTEDSVQCVTEAPTSGIWTLRDDGGVDFVRNQTHRRTAHDGRNAFWLRMTGVGDYFYEGADLGILVTPGRLMDDEFQLTPRAKSWIAGIRAQYSGRPLQAQEDEVVARVAEVAGFKFL
ncbi:biotin carboxylase [Enhygromyxa salina]|uniref:Biotin carboxylase-like protein n=1 Tax=Enhygromyxa salina TaxID=215803 RepID=A0A2S9YC60_9BACT|nr:biotin carboxylase [Enhygromyxa salina]PRQ02689.1 biotin carboxylase-like protein [Enhygromyxa salina]